MKSRTFRQSVLHYLRVSLSLCSVTLPATTTRFVLSD